MCVYKGVVGLEKIVLVIRYTESHTEPEKPMSADKEKLDEEICAANSKQAILVVVLATDLLSVAYGINATQGTAIAAHEKIGVLNLVKEKEVPQ